MSLTKIFVVHCSTSKITVEIKRDSSEDERGYLIWCVYGVHTFPMRMSWDEMDEKSILEDIELGTRKKEYVCFANLLQEINKIKIRDMFGIPWDRSPEERKALFKLWYSPQARGLTHCFQFPLLKGQVSKRFPNGSRREPGKLPVDKVLGF